MKHTIVLKFIAILLAACGLVAAAGSAVGIALAIELNLYSTDYRDWYAEKQETKAEALSQRIVERYAANNLSNCPDDILEQTLTTVSDSILSGWYDVDIDAWTYTLSAPDGTVLDARTPPPDDPDADTPSLERMDTAYTFRLQTQYPVLADNRNFEQSYSVDASTYYVNFADSPEYTVTVHVSTDFLTGYSGLSISFIHAFFGLRYGFISILAVGLLLFAICMVYLCCAAGKTGNSPEVCPGGLNQLPLDLYGAVTFVGCFLLTALAWAIIENWFLYNAVYNLGAVALAGTVLLLAAVLGVGFLFAIAAQFKLKKRFWWHHSLIGRCCGLLLRGLRGLFRGTCSLFSMLPLIWQWLLTAAGMVLFPLFFFYLAAVGRSYWLLPLFLCLLGDFILTCYFAYAFATLLQGTQRMGEGTLHTKIPTKYLFGPFSRCAVYLNALADVAVLAAQKQMRSERMKTELITNVSHDIKTPLTSIINYVDLLENSPSETARAQYLEVLGRQSQRLKKLIEDLMEMSKAATGNIAVEITQVDAAETINQALGEFADKLTAAGLTPVFRQPEKTVAMQADGRLTWRVLSNLLSNIVKYALPGTRVYIDLTKTKDLVEISLKNISREPLNIPADELTERFVRGDAARNTEGSGLGLNIAKSLMELQKGQLQLLVDGDLFKVTLIFPGQ